MNPMLSALMARPSAMSASAATSGPLNSVAVMDADCDTTIGRSVTRRTQMPAIRRPDPASINRCIVRQCAVSAIVRSWPPVRRQASGARRRRSRAGSSPAAERWRARARMQSRILDARWLPNPTVASRGARTLAGRAQHQAAADDRLGKDRLRGTERVVARCRSPVAVGDGPDYR
jgi:hypothetical protein